MKFYIFSAICLLLMFIISANPDSYTPMKDAETIIHLIFSLGIFVFIFENIVIVIIQSLLYKINKKFIISVIPISKATFIIHSIFLIMAFSMKFLLLIKPISKTLYGVLYALLINYTLFKTVINLVIQYFSGKTLNI